jgi:hypothetical protein
MFGEDDLPDGLATYNRRMHRLLLISLVCLGCNDNADSLGVGAQCTMTSDCDTDLHEICLTFKGGYCGLEGCLHDADCPTDSACIAHSDGHNYCFRICIDKPECNANRDPINEANCTSTATFVDGTNGRKACVPPNG